MLVKRLTGGWDDKEILRKPFNINVDQNISSISGINVVGRDDDVNLKPNPAVVGVLGPFTIRF